MQNAIWWQHFFSVFSVTSGRSARAARVLGFTLLISVCGRPVGAQELRGTLITAQRGAPAAGVLIEATVIGSGVAVGRALSGADSRFRLLLPADSVVVLRALRIGHRPTVLDTLRLAPGEIREGRWVLAENAVVLDRVQVVGREVCRSSRAEGEVVVTLLEEIRKAVRATQVRSLVDPLTADWAILTQQTTLEGRPLTERTEQLQSSATSRPFVSLSPDSLAAVGYLKTSDDGYQLFAPDADVLLSPQFLDSHCFRQEPWRGDDRDWIGLGFRPTQRRSGVVGIEGTLWLDRSSAELRRLDFRYVNLPQVLATRTAGGEVEFLRLATGDWLVQRWSIRMPRVAESYTSLPAVGSRRLPMRTFRVTSLQVAGGEVRAVYAGTQTLYRADGAGSSAPVVLSDDDAVSLCADSLAARTGVLWGVQPALGGDARGTLRLVWTDERRWFDSSRMSAGRSEARVPVDPSGLWVACGVPANELVDVLPIIGQDTLAPARAGWILDSDRGARLALDVRQSATERAQFGTIFGRVVDSLQVGTGLGNVTLRVLGSARSAVPDSAGRFAIDSLPPGEHTVALWDERLSFLGVRPPLAKVRVGLDGSAEGALLATPARETFFAARCGRDATSHDGLLVGEVRDRSGQLRSEVTVRVWWMQSRLSSDGLRHERKELTSVTDAQGRYVICGVPPQGGLAVAGREAVTNSPISLVASGASLASGEVTLAADSAWLQRRDVVVGRSTERTRLAGRVLDAVGQPIAGATVLVHGMDSLVTRTTESGAWSLDGVPVRSMQLTVRALRYLAADAPLDPVAGELTAGELRLSPVPQGLAAVVVRGQRPAAVDAFEERRRSLAFGTFLDEATLRRQPQVTPQFLASRIPRAMAAGGTIVLISPSGFDANATCPPLWFVDGVDYGRARGTPSRAAGAIRGVQDEILQQAVRVEIYRAALAPPEFTDFEGCGSVVVWTR